jgi:NAD(P)-dependent dehydrogenase (short-subunit alcohol dehydrogenase family)
MATWRSNFETTFFGHVALTSALTPALVRSGDSRIINVSSMAAVLAGPSFGPYAVAKAALETYSDILRRELARPGVRVIVVQPAAIKTDGWAEGAAATNDHTSTMSSEQHERYDGLVHAVAETSEKWNSGAVPAATASEVIVAAIERSTPNPRYGIGRGTRITAMLMRLLNDRTMDRLLNRMLNLR